MSWVFELSINYAWISSVNELNDWHVITLLSDVYWFIDQWLCNSFLMKLSYTGCSISRCWSFLFTSWALEVKITLIVTVLIIIIIMNYSESYFLQWWWYNFVYTSFLRVYFKLMQQIIIRYRLINYSVIDLFLFRYNLRSRILFRFISDPYTIEHYFDFSWALFVLGLQMAYHFFFLQAVSMVSYLLWRALR